LPICWNHQRGSLFFIQNLDPLAEYQDPQLSRVLELCALKETMDSRQGLETPIT
jgi:hypothetical protein